MSKMICTSECEKCTYCIYDDTNKANIKVYCSLKDKTYFYGQKVPCDNFVKKEV